MYDGAITLEIYSEIDIEFIPRAIMEVTTNSCDEENVQVAFEDNDWTICALCQKNNEALSDPMKNPIEQWI